MTGDEPPVIDLGERPHGDDDDEQPAAAPERRPLSGRLLVLAGAALLAVGFVGGIAVQRAATPDPAATATPVDPANIPVHPPYVGCGEMVHDGSDWAFVDAACSGTIQYRYGDTVVLAQDSGAMITFTVDANTKLTGVSSVTELQAGQRIMVRLVAQDNDTPRATWLLLP